jgi:hypothetical protein
MTAKRDAMRGLSAHVAAAKESVVEACLRATEPFAERTDVQITADGLTVSFTRKVYRFQSVTRTSPVLDYATLQTKALGFIPSGPKMMIGAGVIEKFLDALEAQLHVVDPAAEIRRS